MLPGGRFNVVPVLVVVLVGVIVGSYSSSNVDAATYTTKYDNVDIDAVIKSKRLTDNYVNCLLEKKSCTPDAAELKKNLPDALATDCASCSATQKRVADKISRHLIDERPDDWSLLEAMYDPTSAYRTRYLNGTDAKGDVRSPDAKNEPDTTDPKKQ